MRTATILLAAVVVTAIACAAPAPIAVSPTAAPTTSAAAVQITKPPPGAPTPDPYEILCGTLVPNTITSGQGSGPNTFELRPVTSVRTGSVSSARFAGWTQGERPPLDSHVCV